MNQRNKYLKLTEKEKWQLYHVWVEKHGFIRFTDWEVQVLRGDIKIDIWDLVNERKL